MQFVFVRREFALSQRGVQAVEEKNQNDDDDDNDSDDLKFIIWIHWALSGLFCGEQNFGVREFGAIRVCAAVAILQKLRVITGSLLWFSGKFGGASGAVQICSRDDAQREIAAAQKLGIALVASGGAGPPHALAIARDLHIPTVIVPVFPSHFSALGMLMASWRQDFVRTLFGALVGSKCKSCQGTPPMIV